MMPVGVGDGTVYPNAAESHPAEIQPSVALNSKGVTTPTVGKEVSERWGIQ